MKLSRNINTAVFSLTLFLSFMSFADEEYNDLSKIKITGTQADITFNTLSGSKTTVRVDKTKAASNCVYNSKMNSRELTIDFTQTQNSLNCPFEFNISLPSGVDTEVVITRGKLKASGDFHDSILETDEGSIEVFGNGRSLDIIGKKTKIDFKGATPSMQVEIDDGDVVIDYTSLSGRGDNNLVSRKGNVTFIVPRGIKLEGNYNQATYLGDYRTPSGFTFSTKVNNGEFKIKRN